MAFTRVAALLHSALSDVSAAQHHTGTVAGDLNLADLAENLHASLATVGALDHHGSADQIVMEAETANNKFVRADRIRFSPGVAKVWVKWELVGGHGILASYNMTSVTDGGSTGDTDHLFDDNFSGAEYCVVDGAERPSTVNVSTCPIAGTFAEGGVTTRTQTNDGTDQDSAGAAIVIFGDQ